jgi:uncharacterized protein
MGRKRLPAAAGLVLVSALALADATPPPTPTRYFNDYAGLVGSSDAERLNARLQRFDQETSSQILAVIYPELPSPSLEDFTVRAAQAWRVGQKKLDNGVVLFVFVKDRRARLEVGYGLEGALPDVLSKRILDQTLTPAFRAGRYAEGLEATLDVVMTAARPEYTAAKRSARPSGGAAIMIVAGVLLLALFLLSGRLRSLPIATYRSTGYTASPWGVPYRRQRRSGWGGGWGGGGGGWGGGSGGGGFSGGGGSFGGGGASGSW